MNNLNRVFYDHVRKNDIRAVRRVIYLGANPNYRQALHYAVEKGYYKLAVALLKRGADPDEISSRGDNVITSYLRILCNKKSRDKTVWPNNLLLEELVKRTSDMNLENKYGCTAMIYCARLVGVLNLSIMESMVRKSPSHSCRTEVRKSDMFRGYRLMGLALMTLASPIAASFI